MDKPRYYEQSIQIKASATAVERSITELDLMHRWLNPSLRCEAIGDRWDTSLGAQSRFILQIPFIKPCLISTVVEREPGLVVWGFEGFFKGRDRWECQPQPGGTLLINRFEFEIPNPLIAFGFDRFAATWTKTDMENQLARLKAVAERL
ncbi:MAG: SRPBCC family protein [Alkalinema sp. RU_4_3]|nr:SRPBCC family protein [Alkalinema sp. RU_4_3]